MSLCPECSTRNSKVLDTRVIVNGWLRRRRQCNECDARWATYEIPEQNVTINDPEHNDD
jgi:transcriptional repressor NrdR